LISATWQLSGRKKEIPFKLEVKHVLGQKSQIKMLELTGVWQEDRRQVTWQRRAVLRVYMGVGLSPAPSLVRCSEAKRGTSVGTEHSL
jgi:hypothetical protein